MARRTKIGMYEYSFIVVGSTQFPLDMLRYDGCYPGGSEDAQAIQDSLDEGYTYPSKAKPITLHKWSDNPRWQPTQGRWESFCWKVMSMKEEHRI